MSQKIYYVCKDHYNNTVYCDQMGHKYLNPNIEVDLENEKKVLQLHQVPLSFQSRNKFVISGKKFNFF